MRTPQQALAEAIASGAVQAFARGEKIQCKSDQNVESGWSDVTHCYPGFTMEQYFWRPVPTPTLRPWKPCGVMEGGE